MRCINWCSLHENRVISLEVAFYFDFFTLYLCSYLYGFLFIPFCSSLKPEVLEPSDCSWSHLVCFFFLVVRERLTSWFFTWWKEYWKSSTDIQICLSWLGRQTRREWEGSWNEVDTSIKSLFFLLLKARLISKTNLWSLCIQQCTELWETLGDLCRSTSLDQSMTLLIWVNTCRRVERSETQ